MIFDHSYYCSNIWGSSINNMKLLIKINTKIKIRWEIAKMERTHNLTGKNSN